MENLGVSSDSPLPLKWRKVFFTLTLTDSDVDRVRVPRFAEDVGTGVPTARKSTQVLAGIGLSKRAQVPTMAGVHRSICRGIRCKRNA